MHTHNLGYVNFSVIITEPEFDCTSDHHREWLQPQKFNFFGLFVAVPTIEEEAAKLVDKDGWIRINEFMKFALTTELCKIEFQDRVFQKVDYGDEEKKEKKEKRPKVSTFLQVQSLFIFLHQRNFQNHIGGRLL